MSSHRESLSSDRIAPAVGPYSQAVRCGNMLFCSGIVPVDPDTKQLVQADIALQTRRVLDSLRLLLADCGARLEDVVKTTVFLKNMDDFAQFNAAYADYFPQDPPARSTVEVGRIPLDSMVEIEAIAILQD